MSWTARPPTQIASAIFVIAVTLASCGEETSAVREASVPALSSNAGGPKPRDESLPAGVVLAIGSVDDVMVSQAIADPNALVVTARGTAFAGWSRPQLEPMPDTTGDVRVMSFKFTGVSPKDAVGSDTTQRVSAELSLNSVPATVKTIRIVSATNEKMASVPTLPK